MRAILILALIAAMLLCGCQRSDPVNEIPKESMPSNSAPAPEVDPDGQLICTFKTREEAEKAAELYGIELVSFTDELAVFHTTEDPQEVIRRGQQNGWPELSLNRIYELY